MNLSRPFIRRPIASGLLAIGIVLVGIYSYFLLPVAPLPEVDFPTIQVSANLAGANPETGGGSAFQRSDDRDLVIALGHEDAQTVERAFLAILHV